MINSATVFSRLLHFKRTEVKKFVVGCFVKKQQQSPKPQRL